MSGGQSTCSIHNGSGNVLGASGDTLKPSRTSRTVSREQLSARAISRSPRPSHSRRRISSNRRTVMLRSPISSTPSCGPTKVAGSALAAGNIGRRRRPPWRQSRRGKSTEISSLADPWRLSDASKAPRRWSPTEEIGWSRTQEIRWSSTEETGWSPTEEIVQQQKEGLIQEFQSRVKQNLYTEDGKIKKENIAQIVDDRNFARIKKLFDDAVNKGARIAVGGTLEAADRTIHPTMLTNVTPDMQIMQEEIFGPIVPVLTYKNIDDIIDYISGRAKPLALYIYSNDQKIIDKVLSRTSSGGVTINGFFSHYLENKLPFGGVNQSGMGSYHGLFGFKAFSHERAIYIQENR